MAHWAWVEEQYVQVVDEKDAAPLEPGHCRICKRNLTLPHDLDCALVRGTAEDKLVDTIVTQTAENLRQSGKTVEDGIIKSIDEKDLRTAKGLKAFLEAPSNPPVANSREANDAIHAVDKLIKEYSQDPVANHLRPEDMLAYPCTDTMVHETLAEKWVDGESYMDTDDVLENAVSDFDRIHYELGNDLIGFVRSLQNGALELMISKNADYGGDADPLRNFRMAEAIGVKPSLGIFIRLMDKWARLVGYVNNGELKVKSESVMDTALDMMNYLPIWVYALMVEQLEQEGTE